MKNRLLSLILLLSMTVMMFPSKDSAAYSDWNKAYQQFILEGEYKFCEQEFGYSYDGETITHYEYVEFGLYDLDRNGIPELIAYRGSLSRAGQRIYTYTYIDGKVSYLGTIGAYETACLYARGSEYRGLFNRWIQQGFSECQYITIEDGQYKEIRVFGVNYNTNLTGSTEPVYRQDTSDNNLYQLARSLYEEYDNAGYDDQYNSKFENIFPTYTVSEIASMGWDAFVTCYSKFLVSKPEIIEQPRDYIGASGDTATFTVTATGEDLHYRWQYSDDDGVSWNNGTAYDYPSASCIINNVTDGRLYRCLVYNSAGTVESHAAQVMLRVPCNWRQSDQWTFTNSSGTSSQNFDVEAHGFYISSALYELLRGNLSLYDANAVDFRAADQKKNTPAMLRYNVDGQRTKYMSWGGSCYGMSVTAVLLHEGVLSLFEDFGQSKGSSVSQVGINDEIRSRINYYHHQFALTATQNAARAFMEEMTVADQLKAIEAQVLSGHPVVLSYEGYDYVANKGLAHAVVVYDVETGPFTETSDGATHEYQKKLCVYDCANPNDDKYDIYYTYGNVGIWCLPGHNFISTQTASFDAETGDHQAFPRYNNAAFELASNDVELLNAVSLKDGSISAAVANAKLNSARLYALSDDQYSVTTSGGAIAVDGIRYTKTGENGITAYIAAAPNYLADGSTTVSDVTVFLPEKSSYTVKSDDALSFGFADKGIATFADADSAGAITFRQTGGASIAANKTCDISVTMLADSQNKKWDSVTVTAENGKKLDVVPTDSGAMLTGDSLKGAVVEITDGGKTSSATIDSGINAAEIIYQGGKITVEQTAMVFSDVPSGAYYYQPVYWAVNHVPQITNGTGDNTFSPEWECLRCQIVTFLWRAMGCPEPTSTVNPFVDVKPSDYFYKAVLWAVEQEITNGMDATHFGPNLTCTRGQAVTFLWRAEGKPAPRTQGSEFTDVQNPNDYFYTPVLWAVENGITNGTGDGKFSPNMICLREQIVTFLYRDLA